MDLSKIKGIIFDYGGTLDSGGDHWSEVIWRAYQQAGVEVDKNDFRDAYVAAERELARTRHILPEHNFGDLLLIKMRIELQWLAEKSLFPESEVELKAKEIALICYKFAKSKVSESIPVLEALSKKYKLELVSNFYGNIETVLNDFGVAGFFPRIVESAVVGVRKPDQEIFRLGVKDLGLSPEEVVVVGDSYRKDIEPAIKAGCSAVWIKGKGWTEEEDAQSYSETIYEIRELLQKFGVEHN